MAKYEKVYSQTRYNKRDEKACCWKNEKRLKSHRNRYECHEE